MKESIGIVSLTNIVILFILVFTGYLCISLNQTKAYNVKNQIISIIQKHGGLDNGTLSEIQEYMSEVGYRSTGKCDTANGEEGIDQYGNTGGDRGMICIKKYRINDNLSDPTGQFPKAAYYDIKVFFALDMPVINTIFNFSLKGNTTTIYCPKEDGSCGS